jgi:hypothetical protein
MFDPVIATGIAKGEAIAVGGACVISFSPLGELSPRALLRVYCAETAKVRLKPGLICTNCGARYWD